MKILCSTLLFFCASFFVKKTFAQNNLYEKHLFINGADTLPYRLLLPQNFDANKTYPLILFLHGAGERGNDNEAQLQHGSNLFLKDSIRNQYPAIVVFPQCPQNSFWSNVDIQTDTTTKTRTFDFIKGGTPTYAMQLLIELLNDLEKKYKSSPTQRYVIGLSMGGMGTFELVRRKRNYFAAAIPICGGAKPSTAKKLTKTKWWIFHGEKDDVVPSNFSKQMAEALKNKGADVKLTMYPNANHNSWDSAFAESNLMPWLFSQHK